MKKDFYDENSQVQQSVIELVMPLIKESIVTVTRPQGAHPFTIVDYGCGEGRNSRGVISGAIDAVRSRRLGQHFMVVHNDLPTNNFNRLFDNLYDGGTELYATEYGASDETPVFVLTSAQSFYTQVMPANSVQFGISSSAVHWTSTRPTVKSHIFHGGASERERKEFGAIAASDWNQFLENRTTELAKGGRLVITTAARFDSAKSRRAKAVEHTTDLFSCQTMMDLLYLTLRDLERESMIDNNNLDQFVIPLYCRSEAEILEPATNGALKDRLQVEHCWISVLRCPLHMQYKLDGDAEKYARNIIAQFRAFTEPVLLRDLFGVKERRRRERDEVEEQQIVDSIYDRMQAAVEAEPDRHTFYPIQAIASFRKLV